MSDLADDAALRAICAEHIAARVTPGLAVAFGRLDSPGHVSVHGHTTYDETHPVTRDSLYDIASWTKPLATASLFMDQAAGVLDRELGAFFPGAPDGVTIRHLLGHAAGYPAHVKFYEAITKLADPRSALFERALATPLTYRPGTKTLYSDIGYIILGFVLEEIEQRPFDEQFAAKVATPLNMQSTRFVDHLRGQEALTGPSLAPTEEYPDRGLAAGNVHDENAFAAGGVCGHAGLFSTVSDVAVFARAVLKAWHGEKTWIPPQQVRAFLNQSAAPSTSWRLGWDTPSQTPGVSHAGDRWPRENSFGHLGFTGCSIWLALDQKAYAVILSNRVHPTRNNEGIRELRRSAMDWIAARLSIGS